MCWDWLSFVKHFSMLDCRLFSVAFLELFWPIEHWVVSHGLSFNQLSRRKMLILIIQDHWSLNAFFCEFKIFVFLSSLAELSIGNRFKMCVLANRWLWQLSSHTFFICLGIIHLPQLQSWPVGSNPILAPQSILWSTFQIFKPSQHVSWIENLSVLNRSWLTFFDLALHVHFLPLITLNAVGSFLCLYVDYCCFI